MIPEYRNIWWSLTSAQRREFEHLIEAFQAMEKDRDYWKMKANELEREKDAWKEKY